MSLASWDETGALILGHLNSAPSVANRRSCCF